MIADFSGYATRNNLRCSDGRTILADAFKEQDGAIVPLVWQHGQADVGNVLGHVKLENRDDGVYCHAYFNETAEGIHAKEMVRHGDIKWLSIFANNLKEKVVDTTNNLKNVIHGSIREVSLVLAGANPGAVIDFVSVRHSDGMIETFDDEAYITTGVDLELAHAATPTKVDESAASTEDSSGDTKSLQEILDTLDSDQEQAFNFLLSQALTMDAGTAAQHADEEGEVVGEEEEEAEAEEETEEESNEADESVESVASSTEADESTDESVSENEEASSDESEGDAESTEDEAGDAVQHDNNQEDNSMTHNVFDQAASSNSTSTGDKRVTLSHSDVQSVIHDTLRKGSLKASLEDYALAHGIENIEYLFPDAKTLSNEPNFIQRRVEWVSKVLGGVKKQPFGRIRTIHADITEAEARARGYIKGNLKKEEVFTLLKRDTTPQTVYKKQKLDRDDVLDITDLDVVAWMKAEMTVMLDEELAGAILVGDGRSNADEDKIKTDKIRPIASDDELYATTVNVNLGDADSTVDEFVDAVITGRAYWKGTGMPTFYTSETLIGKFLTVKDSFGHRIYDDLAAVATVMRVSEIVSVDVFDRDPNLIGIMVNLTDYSIGTDRGGQATMFDDFDLDYNKLRYLLETRASGALTLPKSAVVFRQVDAADVLADPTAPTRVDNTITVPTVTGVVYKDEAGTTLTTASPVVLAEGESLHVIATPTSGYYFADNANDEWFYDYEA